VDFALTALVVLLTHKVTLVDAAEALDTPATPMAKATPVVAITTVRTSELRLDFILMLPT
jgi:hypothetical protein